MITTALVAVSTAVQLAHRVARTAGADELSGELRMLGMFVAGMLAREARRMPMEGVQP